MVNPDQLAQSLPLDAAAVRDVVARYPVRINPYFLSLIREPNDPIWRQVVPDPRELEDRDGLEDPLDEEGLSPVPGLIHKYPDRVVLLVSNQCAVYCRFCNRKRKVGRGFPVDRDTIQEGVRYISDHPEVRDVLLSGGDPLLLPDSVLDEILRSLREIRHVEILRIGTRVPCALPQRITSRLCQVLRRHHPLFMSTHFNHPREITPAVHRACGLLADAGIPLGCQTVLLKGVNDDPAVILELMGGLMAMRVQPYYLFQMDLAKGTFHFRTPVSTGLRIMEILWTSASGICVPQFVVDLPHGGGKVPLLPPHVAAVHGSEWGCSSPNDLVY